MKWFFFGITLLLTLPHAVVKGQTVTVSDEISLEDNYNYDIIGKYGNEIWLLKEGNTNFSIYRYDENMYFQSEKIFRSDKRKTKLLGVFALNDGLRVLFQYSQRDTQVIAGYKVSTKFVMSDTVIIDQVIDDAVRKYKTDLSPDKTKLLLHHTDFKNDVPVMCIDLDKLDLMWASTWQMERSDFLDFYRKMIVNNDGNAYLLLQKGAAKNSLYKYSLEMSSIINGQKLSPIGLGIPDRYINDLDLIDDPVHKVINVCGIYSSLNDEESEGIFVLRAPESMADNFRLTKFLFSDDIVYEYNGSIKKSVKSIPNIKIQDIIMRQDGGIFLSLEYQKEITRQSFTGRRDFYGGSRVSIDYYFEDMLLLGLAPDLTNIEFQKVLHKKQYSQDDDALFSSVYMVQSPRMLRFLYNEDIRTGSLVNEFRINGKGRSDRRTVMNTENQKLRLQVRNSTQISSNLIIIPSVRNNKLKLVRVYWEA